MTFREGGQYQGGRVRSTRRGRGAVAAGGGIGIVALLLFLVAQFTGIDLTGLAGDGAAQQPAAGGAEYVGECTAEEANSDPVCRLSVTVEALDTYWTEVFASQGELPLPDVVDYQGTYPTACGTASGATGPFYCPGDQTIYLDVDFFRTLQSQFGADGGSLTEMYVTAHEYGHHIQYLTGQMDSADRSGTGPESDSVRLELQADCYAGLWVSNATTTEDPDTGVPYLEPITETQLADALSAAESVGDDHIQASAGIGVNQDTWTHGSSAQRQRWFMTGYQQGTLTACDTWTTDNL